MSQLIVQTQDVLDWYGSEVLPDEADLCLVRFHDGELKLSYGSNFRGEGEVWMWCVVPPPPQYIKQND